MKKHCTSLPTLFTRPLQTADLSALSHARSKPATHYFYAILILPKTNPIIKFILFSSFPIAIAIGIGIGIAIGIGLDFSFFVFGLLASQKICAHLRNLRILFVLVFVFVFVLVFVLIGIGIAIGFDFSFFVFGLLASQKICAHLRNLRILFVFVFVFVSLRLCAKIFFSSSL